MTMPKTFQTVFGEAFNRALKSAVAPAEREQAERIERQRRLLHYVQVKHTNILRALADR
jgi:hypothetical protein